VNSAPSVGLWSLLPFSLRTAGIIALVTSVTAGVVLYRSTISSERPPEFSRGGRFGGIAQGGSALDDLTVPTPAARSGSTVRSRSSAVLSGPSAKDDVPNGGPGANSRFPRLGSYVYAVEGTEDATAFGSREYPDEMTMTVHRPTLRGSSAPDLEDDEVVFDLVFSGDHEEREIVAYRTNGISFTYEAGSVTFGITQTSEASYKPPMLQVPAKLEPGNVVEGTSRAISPDGEETRVEDWVVTVEGRETIDIMGEAVPTWVVEIERQSRPGSSEQVTRTRRYWFSPAHRLWVKWEEKLDGRQAFGPGSFRYRTEFTATLDRIEQL
jgi:hypothetical protein